MSRNEKRPSSESPSGAVVRQEPEEQFPSTSVQALEESQGTSLTNDIKFLSVDRSASDSNIETIKTDLNNNVDPKPEQTEESDDEAIKPTGDGSAHGNSENNAIKGKNKNRNRNRKKAKVKDKWEGPPEITVTCMDKQGNFIYYDYTL